MVLLELVHRRQSHPVLAVVKVVDAQEVKELLGIVQPALLIKLVSKGIKTVHVLVAETLHVL
ncbi:hypothetical protein FQZ97_1242350 [compost metagenome]